MTDWETRYYEAEAMHTESNGMLAAERDSYKRELVEARAELRAVRELYAREASVFSDGAKLKAFMEGEIVKATERYEQAVIDRNETDAVLDKLRDILHRTAIALKGPEDELSRHSFHDLPEVAAGRVTYAVTVERACGDLLTAAVANQDCRLQLEDQIMALHEALAKNPMDSGPRAGDTLKGQPSRADASGTEPVEGSPSAHSEFETGRDCGEGTSCTSWDCTYPKCGYGAKPDSRHQSCTKPFDGFRWMGDLSAFEKWFGKKCPVDFGGQISVPTGETAGGSLRVWCGSWVIRRADGRCWTLTDDLFRYMLDEYYPGDYELMVDAVESQDARNGQKGVGSGWAPQSGETPRDPQGLRPTNETVGKPVAAGKDRQSPSVHQVCNHADLIKAVRALVFAARTSGGVAGRDETLCAVLDVVESLLPPMVGIDAGGDEFVANHQPNGEKP